MRLVGLPVEGEWLVLNPPGHARFAFDMLAVDAASGRFAPSLRRWVMGALSASDFSGWERPVHAPLDGRVISAVDGVPDRMRLRGPLDLLRSFVVAPVRYRGDPTAMAGNHVLLETAAGYVLLAHLRRDSLTVTRGDQITARQVVGRVGSSGNAVAPHLHFQVSSDPLGTEVVPFCVQTFEERVEGRWVARGEAFLPRRGRIRTAPPHQ